MCQLRDITRKGEFKFRNEFEPIVAFPMVPVQKDLAILETSSSLSRTLIVRSS